MVHIRKRDCMLGNRKQITYIPYPLRENKPNEFLIEVVNILRKRYRVEGELSSWLDIRKMLKTKAIFLNWIEDSLDKRMKATLLLSQLFGVKIIWTFHNKMPHDTKSKDKATSNMKWLANHCDVIWLLSKSSRRYIPNRERNQNKSIYIPHIMYRSHIEDINLEEIRRKYGIKMKDFVFTIFGQIRPYKNIEKGIKAFKSLGLPNAKLMIVGSPTDVAYAKKIRQLSANNEDIILDMQFISNTLLDGIIGISDVIVIPYENESSMNSGVMIHAFSNGKTVISPNICMARDFSKEHFLYRYNHSLEKVMKKAYANGKEINKKMGEMAEAHMKEKHNEKVVSEALYSMLEA